ncbi:hypothetical protein V8B97DRAFT_1864600 [Scleroderma yunnanense]
MSSGSYTPDTNLWLERSRLIGMILGAVSYGMLFLLTIQTAKIILHRRRHGQSVVRHPWLLGYICITFVLATIGFAGNVKYTEMIWIDLRDAPGGPAALIEDELNYSINLMALTCYYIMEWFMQALLLHRCFVIFNGNKYVAISMGVLFLTMVGLSILILAEASGAVFYNINSQLAYLCIEVGMTVIYTLLVAGRLSRSRRRMKAFVSNEDLHIYSEFVTIVVESAALYSVLGIIFIISFALHSNISNLVFLAISHVQAIAQLLIIIRVAQGRSVGPQTSSGSHLEFAVFKSEGNVPYQESMGTDATVVGSSTWKLNKSGGEV